MVGLKVQEERRILVEMVVDAGMGSCAVWRYTVGPSAEEVRQVIVEGRRANLMGLHRRGGALRSGGVACIGRALAAGRPADDGHKKRR